MHNAALEALGRNGVYLPFEVQDATEFIRDFVHPKTKKIPSTKALRYVSGSQHIPAGQHLNGVDGKAIISDKVAPGVYVVPPK